MNTRDVFHKLFEPVSIGKIQGKNRILYPAITTSLGEGGFVTDRLIGYYRQRAENEVGWVVVECTAIDPAGVIVRDNIQIGEDRFIKGLTKLARAIKGNGARAIIQIFHGGPSAMSDIIGRQPLAPSKVHMRYEEPREITVDEIEKMVIAFSQAAVRAREAEFDGLEIHAAHMHLISTFLCPYTNRRTDRYGNDFDGRMRFLLEIIRGIRKSVGRDFPVSCRLDGNEPIENGLTIEDCKRIAQVIEQEGVDAISISAIAEFLPVERDDRNYLQLTSVPPRHFAEGCFVDYASQVKRVVKVPVITVGKILCPEMAESILQEQQADLVAVGRALIADPEWAKKASEGRADQIMRCTECRDCVKTAVQQLVPIRCPLW